MSNAAAAVEMIWPDIEGKRVLEVACGSGEFSLEAVKGAAHVDCIDLDGRRLLPAVAENERITFWQMDAAQLPWPDGSYDTVVLYNAIGRIGEKLPQVIDECRRVVKLEGSVHIISSWMLDKCAIEQDALPCLREKGVTFTQKKAGALLAVRF